MFPIIKTGGWRTLDLPIKMGGPSFRVLCGRVGSTNFDYQTESNIYRQPH